MRFLEGLNEEKVGDRYTLQHKETQEVLSKQKEGVESKSQSSSSPLQWHHAGSFFSKIDLAFLAGTEPLAPPEAPLVPGLVLVWLAP